jgi:hypothetical protein
VSTASDFVGWRGRPWAIWVIAGIGLISNVSSLMTDTSTANVIASVISLALITGLWRGSPGVRLYFIITAFITVVGNSIALAFEPTAHWHRFAACVAIFALLLAPPTHRWAQEQEERRARKKAQRRMLPSHEGY